MEKKIDEIFAGFNSLTPGAAVGIYYKSKLIFGKGYGLASLESRVEITRETNFRLASVTKQFTAMSIMLLAAERKLSLDDLIIQYFPELPKYTDRITVKDLLRHTSGLPDYEDLIDDTTTVQLKDKDVLQILAKTDKGYFEPGTKHKYSNSGYALLALLAEKISGLTFAEFLKDRIFDPLEMKSSVAFEEGISELKNRAFGYAKNDSGYVFSDQSLTSAVLGDGGIYTSVEDMFKWDQALYSSRLIDKYLLNEAWTKAILNDGSVIDYGYGWYLDVYNNYQRIYHTGSTCGFSNVYMRIPQEELSIVVLINIRDIKAIEYGNKIADLILQK